MMAVITILDGIASLLVQIIDWWSLDRSICHNFYLVRLFFTQQMCQQRLDDRCQSQREDHDRDIALKRPIEEGHEMRVELDIVEYKGKAFWKREIPALDHLAKRVSSRPLAAQGIEIGLATFRVAKAMVISQEVIGWDNTWIRFWIGASKRQEL